MTPKNQMELAKLMQEKNDRMGQLYAEKLNNELFPDDDLSETWFLHARQALRKSAPLSHKLSLEEFGTVVHRCNTEVEISLFQFGVMSNSIETVSQKDLDMSDTEYADFIEETVRHIKTYGELAKQIRDEIDVIIHKEFQMKDAADNGKQGGLKPIIGEA